MFRSTMVDLSDHEQFEAAYRRLAPLGLRIAHGVLSDRAAAEDVVQDLFLQLWRYPAAYDPGRGPLRSYVALVARSRSIDRCRSMSARSSALEHLASAEEMRHQEISDSADEAAGQREALLLAYGRGLAAQEIARATDLPVGTAKSRIRLRLARVRQHLCEAA